MCAAGPGAASLQVIFLEWMDDNVTNERAVRQKSPTPNSPRA